MMKDYYKILGITEFDNADNIKSAYRKLARKYHPDIVGNTQDALNKFKEINEAYQVLSNSIKKEEYDKARKFYDYAKSSKTNHSQNSEKKNYSSETFKKNEEFKTNKNKFNWEEFLHRKKQNENYKNEEIKTPKNGENIYTDIEITVFESLTGIVKNLNMLQTQTCTKCFGKKFVNGTTCNCCNGKGFVSNYKKFAVKIPAGIKNNSKIRLAGEGEAGIYGGKNGDLYITIHINELDNYQTDGLNILKKIEITPFDAVLGTEINITTLNGNVKAKIASGTKNGQKIRLANCGIMQNNKVGDMILTVVIQIPNKLSTEEINLYKKLKELSSYKN